MTDITTIGEILIDLTQTGQNDQGIPCFLANPGGAPANLAVAAARLGASTAFIGKVGADSFGAQLIQCLAENKVDTSGIVVDSNHHTTLAVVSVDSTGERSFTFYRNPGADTQLTISELSAQQLSNTRFMHFGSVSLTSEPSKSTTLQAVSLARQNGAIISYDPNYRSMLWKDEKTAVKAMSEPLSAVDILKVSEEELVLLAGTDDLEKGTLELAKHGISLILVTLGAKGAFYRYQGATGQVEGFPCKVADTNGAGDTFFGAVLAQLAVLSNLNELTTETLRHILLFANKAASLATSRHGAIPSMPSLDELSTKNFVIQKKTC